MATSLPSRICRVSDMTSQIALTREVEFAEFIADAAGQHEKVCISGGGSKCGVGADVSARPLSTLGLAGVVDYDPAELILTVLPGTPLAEVQALVAEAGQMLAFDPFDCGPIFGRAAGSSTIGGTVAAGISGSQRVSCGAARDHFLGFRAVSGRGEVFAAGAKVVKNVTGYDLPKLAAGSWGRLFVLTELTLKTLPRPREAVTMAIEGLGDAAAIRAMAKAMGSKADVAAAAHIPGRLREGKGLTLLRIQGFGPSVSARCALLERLLGEVGRPFALTARDAEAVWAQYRTLAPLAAEMPLWRISVPPSRAGGLVASISCNGADWIYDWAGGQVWIACDDPPQHVRQAAIRAGGHATLFRAAASLRSEVPAFHPQPAPLAALEERVRRAFDPAGVFETGRF